MLTVGQTVWVRRTVAPVECVVVRRNGTATQVREVATGILFWCRTSAVLTQPQPAGVPA